jgi:hypothetical protein
MATDKFSSREEEALHRLVILLNGSPRYDHALRATCNPEGPQHGISQGNETINGQDRKGIYTLTSNRAVSEPAFGRVCLFGLVRARADLCRRLGRIPETSVSYEEGTPWQSAASLITPTPNFSGRNI